MIRLDLGAGQRCREGFTSVDIVPVEGGLKVDLFKWDWPFIDGEVDEVNCSHLVEHVPDLCAFMNELGRVMKPGGIVTIRCPYYTSMRAFQDPTHVRFITDASFVYFDAQWRKREGLDHYPITCDFEQVEVKHWIHEDWAHQPAEIVKQAMRGAWNVIEDIEFTLRKREPAGTP